MNRCTPFTRTKRLTPGRGPALPFGLSALASGITSTRLGLALPDPTDPQRRKPAPPAPQQPLTDEEPPR